MALLQLTPTVNYMNKPRVLVLGIDGGTLTILRPWIEEGKLPHLARLMKLGTHGELQSTLPPYTATAWVSFATGKGPGKHGVFDFWRFNSDRRKVLINARAIKAATLWVILSRYGLRVGVVNVPMTYPPVGVNGVMIAGMMTPNERAEYTFPQSLKGELIKAVGDYAANPYASISQRVDFLEKVVYWEEKREEANQYLLAHNDFDFFMNVVQGPDPIQHHFWKYLDHHHPSFRAKEAAKFGRSLLECYQTVDQIVGHRLQMIDERTTMFVLSDHGFGPTHKYFNVNRFLAELGLLVFKNKGSGLAKAFHCGRARMIKGFRRFLRAADVLDLRARILDNRQREALRAHLDRAAVPTIDWAQTKAFYGGVTGQCIHINLAGRDPGGIVQPRQEYEDVRDHIIAALMELRDPDTDEPVVEAAYRKEELYSGSYLDSLPDIVFSMGSRPYSPVEWLSASKIIEPLPAEAGGGRHRPEGILLAAGPNVRRGAVIEGARLIDVAPTILYALGLPVPADMDGQVLLDLFDAGYVAANPVRYEEAPAAEHLETVPAYADEEVEEIEGRLRGLGYLE
jgi:predicted AlkP superfamily phosphohydrolase/phosphomutase